LTNDKGKSRCRRRCVDNKTQQKKEGRKKGVRPRATLPRDVAEHPSGGKREGEFSSKRRRGRGVKRQPLWLGT